MSTGNIISILPDPELLLNPELALLGPAVIVTFSTRQGLRSYRYTGIEVVATILSGGDPAVFSGERIL